MVLATALPPGIASAASIGLTAQVEAGTVTITRTADTVTGGTDYAVSIKGPIHDHGWSYTGELSGTRQTTDSFPENLSDIGAFDVTSNPAGVTGRCASYSMFGELVTTDAPVDTAIHCVLSKDGSTPWLLGIQSTLAPGTTAGNSTTWQGPYTVTQTSTAGIGTTATPSRGDSQIEERSFGGGLQYTMQLSGQVAIGSSFYNGELLSDSSSWFYLHDGPPTPTVNLSGSNDGHTVTGPCTGATTSSGWNFDCTLSLDSAPPADVKLAVSSGDSGTFCSGSSADDTYVCDTYTTGNYTGSSSSGESVPIL